MKNSQSTVHQETMALKQSLLALFGIILPCFLGVAVDAKCCKPDRYSTFGISTDYKSSGAVVRVRFFFSSQQYFTNAGTD